MHLTANLPADFGGLEAIKRDNFPFNQLFPEFIVSVALLRRSTGYSVTDVIGYIEDELVYIGQAPVKSPVRKPVSFRIKTSDSDIIDFYAHADGLKKHTTIRLVKLLLNLSEIYGTSMPHMIYMINKLRRQAETPNSFVYNRSVLSPQPVPASMPGVPVGVVPTAPITDSKSTSEALSESELLSEVAKTPTPSNSTSEASLSSSEAVSEVVRASESPRSRRKAKPKTDDGVAKGTLVTTNPLLQDFL